MPASSEVAFVHDASDPRTGGAEVIGNLAGVVEWANEAFGILTGLPVAQTVNKPVAQFLERVGIDIEVVRFVAEHFLEGRACRVELPYERPDGRTIDVLLEVVALRDAFGEIERFHAFASERGAEESAEGDRAVCAPQPGFRSEGADPADARPVDTSALRADARSPLGISREVARIATAYHTQIADAHPTQIADAARSERRDPRPPLLDLALIDGLPPIDCAREDFEALVDALLRAAALAIEASGTPWGTITVATGLARPGRRYDSPAYAKPFRLPGSRASSFVGDAASWNDEERLVDGEWGLLEVHDTGLQPGPQERGRAAAREQARALAARIGAEIHFDSMPGCGNQVIVLFRR